MNKDYYRILGIHTGSEEDVIKKAYRKLALKYHPDRNPGNVGAEERFKEIAEAYAVLANSARRKEYDSYRAETRRSYRYTAGFSGRFSGAAPAGASAGPAAGSPGRQTRAGFRAGGEDILREMFRNPRTADFFNELQREFERQGFRFNENFFRDLYSRREGAFFRGFSAGASVNTGRRAEDGPVRHFPGGAIRKAASRLSGMTRRFLSALFGNGRNECDVVQRIRISRMEAALGKEIHFTYQRGNETERLSVRIPPGIGSRSRLKLTGMGHPGKDGGDPGDLYIEVKIV